MRTRIPITPLAILLCAAPLPVHADAPGPSDGGIAFTLPSRPSDERMMQMGDWHRAVQHETARLSSAWRQLLRELALGRPDRLSAECRELEERVRALDHGVLFPVPDGSIEFFLKKSLVNLEMALRSCQRERYFETVYRLEEAETAFRRVIAGIRYYALTP